MSYLSINHQINRLQCILNEFNHVVLIDSQILSAPETFFPDTQKKWKEVNLSHLSCLPTEELRDRWAVEAAGSGREEILILKNFDEAYHSEQVRELITDMIKGGRQSFIASVDWNDFRAFEKDPAFASQLRFAVADTRSGYCSDKSALIVGATSLLGGSFMRIFPERFKTVCGTGYSKADQFGCERLDVTQDSSVKTYFEKHTHPDVLIYVSGEANADKAENEQEAAYALNTEAVAILHKYCPDTKFVYISTEYVFDGKSAPHTSESSPNPINYYGRTKLEGEWLSLKLFEQSICLRLGALYGYNGTSDKKTTVAKMLQAFEADRDLKVDEQQIKHPIYLDDVAATLIKLLEQGVSGVFQANGATGYNKVQMAQIALECWNESARNKYSGKIEGFVETGGCPKPMNTFMLNVDTPRSFREGISSTLCAMDGVQACRTEQTHA